MEFSPALPMEFIIALRVSRAIKKIEAGRWKVILQELTPRFNYRY